MSSSALPQRRHHVRRLAVAEGVETAGQRLAVDGDRRQTSETDISRLWFRRSELLRQGVSKKLTAVEKGTSTPEHRPLAQSVTNRVDVPRRQLAAPGAPSAITVVAIIERDA
jgi:hypothetical protein